MHVITTSRLLITAIAALFVTTACNAQSAAPVAKVNGVNIPQSRLELLLKANNGKGAQQDTPEVRNRLKEALITREVMAQEASRRAWTRPRTLRRRSTSSARKCWSMPYVQDYFKNNPVNEDAMKKEYERIKSQLGEKEYKARHILVKDEEEAKKLVAQLKKGGNFEKLAAEKSEDQGSKGRGGDLDWSAPGRYVKPFSDALVKLKKGQLTDPPVQTQFGWHIIRLDDERPFKAPSYEELKPNLQQRMQQQALDKVIGDLRAKAKIE
jgi:peptidyl-prolyl cis-trans isomerase C